MKTLGKKEGSKMQESGAGGGTSADVNVMGFRVVGIWKKS